MYNQPVIEKTISEILRKKGLTLAVAESCTGGLISSSLTDIPGSSQYFLCGIVAYANKTKSDLLNVPAELIKMHGAVSQEVALALAQNVKHLAKTNIGLGITGIAGPQGGTPLKPVGTVFIAVSIAHHHYFKKYHFAGNRSSIKKQAKDAALQLLKECLL